jgi:hypothetical protein
VNTIFSSGKVKGGDILEDAKVRRRCQISKLMLIIKSARNNCSLLYYNITNAMEHTGLLEESMVVTRDEGIPCLLWNPNVQHHF